MAALPREDQVCPYCRGPNPFTITDTGMKIEAGPDRDSSTYTVQISRRPWELEMMGHLKVKHHTQWARIIAELADQMRPHRPPAIHAGLAVIAWMKDMAPISDSSLPAPDPGTVGVLLGLPVIPEPAWHQGRWEIQEDGQVTRHGQVGADHQHVLYVRGTGFVGVDRTALEAAGRNLEDGLFRPYRSEYRYRYGVTSPVVHMPITKAPTGLLGITGV